MKPAPVDPDQISRVLDPFGSSLTFPADVYLSEDLLAWEREHLWQSTWNCVGRLDELVTPGQLRAIDVGGEGVLLSRDADRNLRAFSNVCRHRGHELAPIGGAATGTPPPGWSLGVRPGAGRRSGSGSGSGCGAGLGCSAAETCAAMS